MIQIPKWGIYLMAADVAPKCQFPIFSGHYHESWVFRHSTNCHNKVPSAKKFLFSAMNYPAAERDIILCRFVASGGELFQRD